MSPGRLSGPQLKQVREALFAAFDPPRFKELLDDCLDVRVDTYAMSDGQPFPDLLRAVVRGLEANDLLFQLIEAAIAARPEDPSLQALRSLAPSRSTHAGDPFDVAKLCLMDDCLPLIDRIALRKELPSLGSGQHRTLVINGARCTGKTYTRYLLDFVARTSGRFKLVYCDIKLLATGGRVQPERLALNITAPMSLGEGLPTRGSEKPEAWAADFAAWLEGRLAVSEQTYWVVIDHCNPVLLDQGCEDLLINLANRAETLERLRLILVDYEGVATLRSLRLRRLREEQVQPVTETDVFNFFRSVYEWRRERAGQSAVLAVDDWEVLDSTQKTWQQIDLANEEWLVGLGDKVAAELERILQC